MLEQIELHGNNIIIVALVIVLVLLMIIIRLTDNNRHLRKALTYNKKRASRLHDNLTYLRQDVQDKSHISSEEVLKNFLFITEEGEVARYVVCRPLVVGNRVIGIRPTIRRKSKEKGFEDIVVRPIYIKPNSTYFLDK